MSFLSRGRLTRKELQAAEEPKFRFLRDYLSTEMLSSSIDRSRVGWFRLQDGIFWLALYREPEGATEFLDAAIHHLALHALQCHDVRSDVHSLFACFRTRIGLFLARMLSDGCGDWADFDDALGFSSRSWEISGPEPDPATNTPFALFIAALAALGTIHGHPAPRDLIDMSRTGAVTPHFRHLRDTLFAVIDSPGPAIYNRTREAYRAAISISDCRDAIVRGLQFQHLVSIAAVAEGGDFKKGALEIFE